MQQNNTDDQWQIVGKKKKSVNEAETTESNQFKKGSNANQITEIDAIIKDLGAYNRPNDQRERNPGKGFPATFISPSELESKELSTDEKALDSIARIIGGNVKKNVGAACTVLTLIVTDVETLKILGFKFFGTQLCYFSICDLGILIPKICKISRL